MFLFRGLCVPAAVCCPCPTRSYFSEPLEKMSAKSLTTFELSLRSQIEQYKELIDAITLKNVDQQEIGNGLKLPIT